MRKVKQKIRESEARVKSRMLERLEEANMRKQCMDLKKSD